MRYGVAVFLTVLVIVANSQIASVFGPDAHPLRYRKRTERCFRRAGAMSRYYFDQKNVDISKMAKCLRKADRSEETKVKNKIKDHDFSFSNFFFNDK